MHLLLRHALHEEAVGLNHHLRIRSLHRKDDLLERMAFGDTEKFERALDHAERRVAIPIHDPVGE